MTDLVAIDPGEARWGIALFTDEGHSKGFPGWHCSWVAVMDCDRAQDWLDGHLRVFDVDHLVYERWQLYPGKLEAQTGSECGTAESIGVIKWLVNQKNRELDRHPYSGAVTSRSVAGTPPLRIELHALPASAKMPVPGLMKAAGIPSKAKEIGGPTHDTLAAEQLGWAWLFQTKRVRLPA